MRAAWGFFAVPLLVLMRAGLPAFCGCASPSACSGRAVSPADAPSSSPRCCRLRRVSYAANSTRLTLTLVLYRHVRVAQRPPSRSSPSFAMQRRQARRRRIGCDGEYPRDHLVIFSLSRVLSVIGDSYPISGCFYFFVIPA